MRWMALLLLVLTSGIAAAQLGLPFPGPGTAHSSAPAYVCDNFNRAAIGANWVNENAWDGGSEVVETKNSTGVGTEGQFENTIAYFSSAGVMSPPFWIIAKQVNVTSGFPGIAVIDDAAHDAAAFFLNPSVFNLGSIDNGVQQSDAASGAFTPTTGHWVGLLVIDSTHFAGYEGALTGSSFSWTQVVGSTVINNIGTSLRPGLWIFNNTNNANEYFGEFASGAGASMPATYAGCP